MSASTSAFTQDVGTQATASFVRMWRKCKDDLADVPKETALLIFKVAYADGMKEGMLMARDWITPTTVEDLPNTEEDNQ